MRGGWIKAMRAAVITVAGISSRFNKGLDEAERCLKAIFHGEGSDRTLLLNQLGQCSYADRIVVVGGYRYDDLRAYVEHEVPIGIRNKISLVYNPQYEDLSSGYSLYMGLEKIFTGPDADDILFIEGDLYVDRQSFGHVVDSPDSVLTYNRESIYADKAVVFYRDGDGRYRYAFDPSHGMLRIDGPFSCIFNSGQLWKFTDMKALKEAMRLFGDTEKTGTNLEIIQGYIDLIGSDRIRLVSLERWVNCNTREDFYKILGRSEVKDEKIG